MEKWRDRASPEHDPIDRFVILSTKLFKSYSAQIAKLAPPVAGFVLFLLYFYDYRFYPSFDLLQFSSLLIAASIVGFSIIGFLWLCLLLPGLWIFHGFIKKQDIRERIAAWLSADESRKIWRALTLMLLCYFGPYGFCALLVSSVLISLPGLYVPALACLSLLAVLLFGIAIQVIFKLPKFSFFRYAYNAWVPVLAVNAMAFMVIADAKTFIDGLADDHLKVIALYLIPLGACLVAAVSAMGSFGGLKYAFHFSLFFALAIAFYSGILAGLPERTVRALGLGNYQAKSVIFEPRYCSGAAPKELPFTSDCSLADVRVIWSLGETLTLLIGSDKDARQVQIPSRFIKAIVRHDWQLP